MKDGESLCNFSYWFKCENEYISDKVFEEINLSLQL